MTKLEYKTPEVELIGLSTYEICGISIEGSLGDDTLPFGGEDDGTHDPNANKWDHFDNTFGNK